MKHTWVWLCLVGVGLMAGDVFADQSATRRMRSTEIPRLQFRAVGVDDVFETLTTLAREADPEGTGVNILYLGPEGADAPRITLSLRRVTLYDAIRYVTQAAGLHYRIDENAVVITAAPAPSARVETRVYPVQPAFKELLEEEPETPKRRDWFFR